MAAPDDKSNRDGDDPLGSFELEPQASGEPLKDLSMHPSEPVDEQDLLEGSALAAEYDANVTRELRAQLEKSEQTLDSTVSDVAQLKREVAALRSELATLVGSMKDVERRVRRHGDAGVLSALGPIVPAARRRSYGIAAIGLAIVMVVGVALWQLRSPLPASEPPQSIAADSTGTPPSPAPPPAVPANTSAAVQRPAAPPPADTEPPEKPQDVRPMWVGTLRIQTDPPGATVLINRKPIGTTPLRAPYRAGSHLIWLEREGYRRWTRVVAVPADQVTTITATLQPDR